MLDAAETCSLNDFQQNAPEYVKRIKGSRMPIVLTVDGRAELVVQDAASYQEILTLLDRLATVEALKEGLEDVKQGRTHLAREVLGKQKIVEIVRRYLKAHEYDDIHISVVVEGVHWRDGMWQVPVRSDTPMRTYRYYDELTEVEDDIKVNEHLDVLLVPAG